MTFRILFFIKLIKCQNQCFVFLNLHVIVETNSVLYYLYKLKKESQTWISLVFVLFHMVAIQTSYEQMFICQRRCVETWEKE